MQGRCARCGGNQFRIRDQYGDYLSCLQCGRTTDLSPVDGLNVVLRDLRSSYGAARPREGTASATVRRQRTA